MKTFLILGLIIITGFNFTVAQDAKSVLIQSQQAVKEINTCSYLLFSKSKVTGMRDTAYQVGKCRFIRFDNDTLLGKHIYIENFSGITEAYDGFNYFKSRRTDSTVYIWDAAKFNFFKHQLATNPIAYGPLFNKKNIYSQLLTDSETTLALLADTVIDEAPCYHIRSFSEKKNDKQSGMTINAELFIRKSDFIPVGHIQFLQSNFNKGINNYESVFLEQLEINKVIDENIFSLTSVPANYTFKQQTIINIKNYIVANEAIPDFDFSLLKSDSSFKNVKGKNILIAFIEPENCFPCISAMKIMEEFYHEYKKKNLVVLIISTHWLYVKNDFDFLKDQDKIFPSLYDGQKIIDKTAIGTFPTFYLINKLGEQVYKSEGFNERLKKELEKELTSMHIK
ncbi:MAG: redoxin domain-containing protein [Bacteroidia bacterium]